MRYRIIFWLLFILIFGMLVAIGSIFLKTDLRIFIIIEAIALLSIILFILFYNMLLKPYRVIGTGMDLLKQQDFSSRLRPVGHGETDRMIEIFNKMMDQLKEERLHVREQNRFLDLLIDASPQGLIILDYDDKITHINPAGLRLLKIESQSEVIGQKPESTGIEIGKTLASLKHGEDAIIRISGTIYRCSRSSFMDKGFLRPFILIEELTHEVLKIEKRSYENIIRMMAHEVNNSVAAVSSTLSVISYSLQKNGENELADVLPAVNASYDRCSHLSRFITNFADVVKIPLPVKSPVELNELAHSVEALCSAECSRRNIRLSLLLANEPCHIQADGIQIEQVLVNIVKNAYESIRENGEIRIVTLPDPCQIIVEDTGPGIPEDIREKLFTPFFTTKISGQGIGLMFIREVFINHGWKFSLTTDEDTITRFRIKIS